MTSENLVNKIKKKYRLTQNGEILSYFGGLLLLLYLLFPRGLF